MRVPLRNSGASGSGGCLADAEADAADDQDAAGEAAEEPALNLLGELEGDLKTRLETLEARIVRESLIRHRWNKTRAAKELGLSRVGLRSKLTRYGLDKGD